MVTIVNNKSNLDPIEFNSLKSYLKLIPRANFGKININFLKIKNSRKNP